MSHWKNYAVANWGKSEEKKSSKGGVREDNCKGFKEAGERIKECEVVKILKRVR